MERRVTIADARALQLSNPNALLLWRPNETLPEEQQYAVVLYE